MIDAASLLENLNCAALLAFSGSVVIVTADNMEFGLWSRWKRSIAEKFPGEVKRFDGTFKDFPVSREEAEEMIIQARLKAGWITEADLAPPADEAVEEGAPA